MTDRICPRCKGTGSTSYRKDFGICYRCNGFGTLNPNGSKKMTAAEKREIRMRKESEELIAQYKSDPRFAPLKAEMEKKYGDCLDGFLYTSDYAVACMLRDPEWKG